MSYAYTHLTHKTITDNINSMHLYYELIQVLLLITGLRLFEYPVEFTDLILMQKLILITYSYTEVLVSTTKLILVLWNLYWSFETWTCISDLIHVLQSIYLSYGAYTGITELRHVFKILYMSYRTYTYLTELILVLQNLFLSYVSYNCAKVPIATISQNKSDLYRYISGMDISP